MKTKLIDTPDYLLLIDEGAEIKEGDYILEKESIINIFPDYLTDLDECKKIIAYYPLSKEAKELDLLLLPPFEAQYEGVNIDLLDEEDYVQYQRYKAAQSKGKYSLEDMKKAIEMAREQIGESDNTMEDFYTEEEIIQSLSTQQLPKEFIPEYEINKYSAYGYDTHILKTVTNSEGKEVLVGRYVY